MNRVPAYIAPTWKAGLVLKLEMAGTSSRTKSSTFSMLNFESLIQPRVRDKQAAPVYSQVRSLAL